MAVFTPLDEQDIKQFLSLYDVGELQTSEGILQGVDNTNYKIETSKSKFILTVFENRINPDDLPFFLGLMEHLSKSGIICPFPYLSLKDQQPVSQIKGKPAALFSFLEGRDVKPDEITIAICKELGQCLGAMHMAGQKFQMTRDNSMSFDAWEQRFHRIGRVANPYLEHLHLVKANWPKNLPRGAIHADLFPDNVFIKDNHIYGVIDFYFSCTDFLAYDLAIVVNAWCFDGTEFNQDKFSSLLDGYQSVRPLTQDEKQSFQTLSQGAALRFLSSRLHDYLFHDPSNLVTPKPPDEYVQKLEFHKHVKLL